MKPKNKIKDYGGKSWDFLLQLYYIISCGKSQVV